MMKITRYLSVIGAITALTVTVSAQAQMTSAQVRNNTTIPLEMQTQIQEGLSQQTRGNSQTSNRAITPIYVGSFNTNDGPNWNDAPPALSAIEAAALIFGGRAVDYVISTNPNTTDPSTITHTAWATKYGIVNCHEVAEDYFLDQGTPGYNINGDTSAYVDDNCLSENTNYVWSVRDPSTFITTWETTAAGESITIPTAAGSVYNYDVDWESDGTWETGFTGDATHTYATAGTYMVTIRGTFPRIYFNNTGDKNKIKAINQWGYQIWESMESAFHGCSNLIYNSSTTPDLSAVTSMANMFTQANLFDADISNWDVSNVTDMTDMFAGVTLPTFYYDSLLTAWSNLTLQNNVNFSAGSSHYCNSETARDNIINIYGWTISDGGKLCVIPDAFITTWQTTVPNESITIPTFYNSIYNYDVDWEGLGFYETGFTNSATHTYANPGIHTVVIRGTFPRIYFNNSGDKDKIMTIEKWGPNAWESMENAFYGCSNLTYNATDAPNLTNASNMTNMFSGATLFNGDLSSWNVANIDNMTNLFNNATLFNGDISTWDVSNVTGMSQTFAYAAAFNKDIGSWDVSSVIDMNDMFFNASSFDQDIGDWNIYNVSTMDNMIEGSAISSVNYDRLLLGWSSETLQNGVTFNAGTIEYCTSQAARDHIISTYGWSITDGGQNCAPCTDITEYTTGSWSNGLPDNTKIAVLIDDYNTTNGKLDACGILIRPGATLTVSDGTFINAENNLIIDGNLIFDSSATGNGELASMGPSGAIYGDATVQRYMKNKRSYRMVSSAVTTSTSVHDNWQEGAISNTDNPNAGFGTHITGSTADQMNGFDGTITGNPSMFTVNVSTQMFEAVTNTDVNTLTAGEPYLLFVRGDRSIDLTDDLAAGETVLRATGSLVTGTQTQNYATSNAGDVLMFGNPYQSAVDVNTVFAASTNLNTGYYYVYDSELGAHGSYVTVMLPGGTNTSGSVANQFLQPGQGAQAVALAAGATSVVFDEANKAPGNFTSTSRPVSANDMLTVQLYTTENFNNGGPVHDSFGVIFAEGNDNGLTAVDAVKPMNFYENLGINNNGTYLSIEQRALPQAAEVYPMYSTGYTKSDYTLKVIVEGLEANFLYLDDHFTGTSILLEAGEIGRAS